ncbi:MAG TPA: hypothetical protein PL033_05070 [Candidatus Brocadiia bacterium]|nr:hypothetical protein [Candidatus Brocadiia bacterium]
MNTLILPEDLPASLSFLLRAAAIVAIAMSALLLASCAPRRDSAIPADPQTKASEPESVAADEAPEAELPPPPDIAPNPGFDELDHAGNPVAWTLKPPVYSLSVESPRGGLKCLRFENADPKNYVLCSSPIELKIGSCYEFSVWVRTENVEGEDTGATICVEWWGRDGGYLGGAYPAGVKGTSAEWTLVRGHTAKVPENTALSTVACYVRKGMTGKAWWDDVVIKEYVPPLLDALVTNKYRDMTDGGPVLVKAGVNLKHHNIQPERVMARLDLKDANGKTLKKMNPTIISEGEIVFSVDSSELAPGDYTLECEARIRYSRAKGGASRRLRKVARLPERKAWIDDHQRLILDGKPFFPLGTYWGGVKASEAEIYAKSPFNCVMPYGGASREMLDLLDSNGVKVIYSVKDLYSGTKFSPKEIQTEQDERRAIEETLAKVGNHPGVIAWYINDELPLEMLDRLAEHRDWMEELDPGRPTWVVLYQVTQVRGYIPTFDVIGTDPYPIPEKPPSMALDWARMTSDGVLGCRAVWMVPQIFNWASYREDPDDRREYRAPTLDEMRSMAWQCIAGGANGLIFYSWFDLWRMSADKQSGGRAEKPEPFDERWKDVTAMAAEIERFFPVLLSVAAAPTPIAVEGSKSVAWRIYGKDGFTYLVAVNSGREPAEATFRFAGKISEVKVELGAETMSADGGAMTASFSPLEAKVVRLKVSQ